MEKLKLLDLFSGIGGFSLGLERTGGFETVAFCEYDEKAQKVLKKHWPEVPIYKDVRTIDYDGTVDIITGGYPCQPFSFAGKRKGAEDDRHLWPAMFKLIQKHRPTWVIGENVAGHINMGLDSVLADLESENYRTRTFVIPAVALNAKHRRDRLWIVGHAEHDGSSSCGDFGEFQRKPDGTQTTIFEFEGTSSSADDAAMADTNLQRQVSTAQARNDGKNKQKPDDKQLRGCGAAYGSEETMADTTSKRQQRQGKHERPVNKKTDKVEKTNRSIDCCKAIKNQWLTEPAVGRVANGIPRRMDRLKQLGNAVVPQIPEIIGNAILEVEGYNRNVQCN
jgi:DNA (cytosine-5)-methyltransferase 1